MDYVFLMVVLGSLVFIGFVVRIPGSTLFASIFALGLFGVPKAQATAMTLMVIGSFLTTIAILGGLAFVWQGVKLAELKQAVLRDTGCT